MARAPNPKPLEKRAGHSLLVVRLIAIAKFFKSAALLIVGFLILHYLKAGGNLHDSLHDFVNAVRLDPNNHFIHGLIEKATGIKESTLRAIGVGTLVYSALYLIEGIGLFLDMGWAEWMTVVTTAGFLPFEIFEIVREITIVRVVVFLLNLGILVYIALRIHWRLLAKKQARIEGRPFEVVKREAEVRSHHDRDAGPAQPAAAK